MCSRSSAAVMPNSFFAARLQSTMCRVSRSYVTSASGASSNDDRYRSSLARSSCSAAMRARRSVVSRNARSIAGTKRIGRSFDKKSSAPACSAATASASFGVPEITMHDRSDARARAMACRPPNPGIIQSVIIKSQAAPSAASSSLALATRRDSSVYPPRRISRTRSGSRHPSLRRPVGEGVSTARPDPETIMANIDDLVSG